MNELDTMTFEQFEQRGKTHDNMVAVFRLRFPREQYYFTENGYAARMVETIVFNKRSLIDRIANLTKGGYDCSLSKSVLAQWPA